MKEVVLKIPNKLNEGEVLAFVDECARDSDEPVPGVGIDGIKDYDKWLIYCFDRMTHKIKNRVRAFEMLAFDKQTEELVGVVNIRQAVDDYVMICGGNIAMVVSPYKRGQGYGTAIIAEAVRLCKEQLHLTSLVVSCAADNFTARYLYDKMFTAKKTVMYDRYHGIDMHYYWVNLADDSGDLLSKEDLDKISSYDFSMSV